MSKEDGDRSMGSNDPQVLQAALRRLWECPEGISTAGKKVAKMENGQAGEKRVDSHAGSVVTCTL